jgi:hypothetical protein
LMQQDRNGYIFGFIVNWLRSGHAVKTALTGDLGSRTASSDAGAPSTLLQWANRSAVCLTPAIRWIGSRSRPARKIMEK